MEKPVDAGPDPAADAASADGGSGLYIVMTEDRPPVITIAGKRPKERADEPPLVIPSGEKASEATEGEAEALAADTPQQDVNSAAAEEITPAADVRLKPPSAADLLGKRVKDSKKTTVAALPTVKTRATLPIKDKITLEQLPEETEAQPEDMPAYRQVKPRTDTSFFLPSPRKPDLDAETVPAKVQQVLLSPNAAAKPKVILTPSIPDQTEEPRSQAKPIFLPSPRKPAPAIAAPAVEVPATEPQATVEQAALAPTIGAAPKTAVLRTAPSPNNQLVELVETPDDQAIQMGVGRGQLLNLGMPVTDIFVADPNIADVKVVSPKKLFVHGNLLGRTNIFGIDKDGDVVIGIDLQVVPDADAAKEKIKAISPDGNANIQLVSDRLIADGVVQDVGEAVQVAALSDQIAATDGPIENHTAISGSQQVNLRVRFAEVSREDVVNLGVNWNALGNTGDFLIGLSNGPDIGDLAGLAGDLAGDPSVSGGIPGSGEVNVEAFIDVLHQEGIISLLAEPNLTAINGEPGTFLAGSEIPIPIPGPDGQTFIDYKEVGVSLEYLPTLLPGNRINLRLRPEVSSPNSTGGVIIDGFQIPSFTVRRTDTSVELTSGQTMALAGLFQRDVSTDVNKFPILGDLPILGKLFRSERYQRAETELVILITPYLVQPTNVTNVIGPNDRIDTPQKPLTRNSNKRRAGFIIN